MELMLDQAVTYHRKMWHGIAGHIRQGKSDGTVRAMKNTVRNRLFPELYKEHVHDGCFLCEFAKNQAGREHYCAFCPMLKKATSQCLDGRYSEFWLAVREGRTGMAAKIAEKIANLPVINPRYMD